MSRYRSATSWSLSATLLIWATCFCASLTLSVGPGFTWGVGEAMASVPLSNGVKRQVLRSANLGAPNGRILRRIECIDGRLSSVDPRWATVHLTNTRSCVDRYGGASGESTLLKRQHRHPRRWRRVGSVSDNCTRGEGGASDAILRDLGCRNIY